MTDKQYTYSVARIRGKELGLLNKQAMEQLLACKNYEECLLALVEKGYCDDTDVTIEKMLKNERKNTWELMKELVDDLDVFSTFILEDDFHNLKAAIKEVYLNKSVNNIYVDGFLVNKEVVYQAVKDKNFNLLPSYMQSCCEEALEVMLHTHDSQLTDIIIDKKALETIYDIGMASDDEIFRIYAELKVAFANINIALRCNKMSKTKDYMLKAMVACKSLDINKLVDASLEDEEAICEYLKTTVYAEMIQYIKKSSSALEKYCDDKIIEKIKPQKCYSKGYRD